MRYSVGRHVTPRQGCKPLAGGRAKRPPPVQRLQGRQHPGRGASSSMRESALNSIATRAKIAAATPSGVEIEFACIAPGVSLRSDPRLIAAIPPGSNSTFLRNRQLNPAIGMFQAVHAVLVVTRVSPIQILQDQSRNPIEVRRVPRDQDVSMRYSVGRLKSARCRIVFSMSAISSSDSPS
jgi:hypothetical protein